MQLLSLVAMTALMTVMTVMSVATAAPAMSDSSEAEVPEHLQELMLVRRLVGDLEARMQQALPSPISPAQQILLHDIMLLNRASGAGIDFRKLMVSKRSMRAYCGVYPGIQCRSVCMNLGDSACADGDMGRNGEDASFIEGGFNPGK